MNGLLKATDTSQIEPTWTHPTIPGQAVQGSLLFTTTDFVEPPQSSNVMKWIPMEDIVGLGNVKSEYDEKENKVTLYKTRQHLNSDGQYEYDWVSFAVIKALPEDVQELLVNLEYVRYYFELSDKSIKFTAKKKDGTIDDLGTFTVYSIQEIDKKVEELNNTISTKEQESKDRDNTLQSNLDSEIVRREQEDTAIQDKLKQEITDRTNADNTLQTNIDNEITNRKNADTNLFLKIENEARTRDESDGFLKTSIETEIKNREDADTNLQTQITTNKTNIDTNANSISDLQQQITTIVNNGAQIQVVSPSQTKTLTKNTLYFVGDSVDTGYQVDYFDGTVYKSLGVIRSNSYFTTIKEGVDECKTRLTNDENKISTNTTNISTNTTDIENLTTTVNKNKVYAGDLISVTYPDNGTFVALSGTSETWTFTLADGTTVDRTVRYF